MAGSQWLNSADAAYPAMARLFSAHQAARSAADQGYYVASGGAITASGTAGKVDMAAAVDFMGTTELNVTAVTAASTTITSLADATNPKWVILEVDSSGVLQFNAGTAAASPVTPTLTASRVPHAWLYVPANATAVDALLSTANGNAKIIDARELRSVHPARLFARDTTQTILTNPTSATTLLASAPSVPANSLNVGDTFVIEGSFRSTNNAGASTIVYSLLLGALSLHTYTTASLNASATGRTASFRMAFTVTAIGSGTSALVETNGTLVVASTTNQQLALGGGAGGDYATQANTAGGGFDSTAANTIDCKVNYGTSSAAATIALRQFSITKIPA